MDPYVYPNSSVLNNKLNIRDEQELIYVEAPEPSYLDRIITDALNFNEKQLSETLDANQEQYRTIGQYDVANYEEKPFNKKMMMNNEPSFYKRLIFN